jgi:hypothetical protein
MSKFNIEIFSPDGEFKKEEIESALAWLCNHDGKAIRALYKVKDINYDYCDCETIAYCHAYRQSNGEYIHSNCGKQIRPGTLIEVKDVR